ncbi:MAG: cysteine--tRNA ligase [Clostridiales bacterium]|jgi:cysteinyl-tRNA synthetase|nr:cysteine--tRNA ligase [Clostridiales bacterium]
MKLYNSLTRKKEEFIPIKEGEVRFYSCGPTVYNFFHIGNARPFIIFDALRGYFEYLGNKVIYVQNFTDVDDKMINRAREEGITVRELGEKYIGEYQKDAEALKIRKPTYAPKATDTIPEIIEFIQRLVDKEYAYEMAGNVYFATEKFAEYGKLSHQPLDELEAGARIEVGEEKRAPADFALWKRRKEADEIAWDSPWGEGRPGWHIECSTMANKFLGANIDIHSGGQDLIFPHHENEVAQSEAANGRQFANFWLHNGYINVDNRKMSKSLGNFFTVRDILKQVSADAVRFFMLSAHYRSPINFSFDLIKQAEAGLERLKSCVSNLEFLRENGTNGTQTLDTAAYKQKFLAALDDDFNTAAAIAVLFDLTREINTLAEGASAETIVQTLLLMRELAGILRILPDEAANGADGDGEITRLVSEREAARAARNFALADQIRDKLTQMGVTIEDTPGGTRVKMD